MNVILTKWSKATCRTHENVYNIYEYEYMYEYKMFQIPYQKLRSM